jgi:hypothetical protein
MLTYADARKSELQAIQYIEGRAEQKSTDLQGKGALQLPSPKRKRGRKVQDEGGGGVGGVSRSGGGVERSAGAYSSGAARNLIESLESLEVCAEEAAREEGYLLAHEGHPLAEVVGRKEAEEAAGEELEEGELVFSGRGGLRGGGGVSIRELAAKERLSKVVSQFPEASGVYLWMTKGGGGVSRSEGVCEEGGGGGAGVVGMANILEEGWVGTGLGLTGRGGGGGGSRSEGGSGGEVLYVGKAKNLRKRVMSYIRGANSQAARIRAMLARAETVWSSVRRLLASAYADVCCARMLTHADVC